ncbi:thioredoxin TrxC [Roseomonas fluvialis]|uniref:Thiol reductase thioredoxin n=1 Tax=Roseomonas fluvialis TaxID=1750527 RepID=A0ABM7Y3F3_9PROT|nr:thioredoxin TrxC [Roseomonas fluvialis]BDG72382.1 thiol reductase thioredoxin [Roseomonas fluvialis]
MSEALQVVCPRCDAVNRVPATRIADHPVCGACKGALFTGKPVALDEARFRRQLRASSLPLLVDFWASWCGPCRAMAPQFEAAAGILEPGMRLVKVSTEDAPALAQEMAIQSIPTLALFRGGAEVARQAGAMGAAQIVAWARQVAG